MTTKILACSCSHAYQDKLYGKGNRVHNLKAKGEGWTCTVCDGSKS